MKWMSLCEFRNQFLCQILCSVFQGWLCVWLMCMFYFPASECFLGSKHCWVASSGETDGIGLRTVFITRLRCATLVSQSRQIVKCGLSLQRASSACSLYWNLPSVWSSVFRREETKLLTVFHFLWFFPISYSRQLFFVQINLRICHLVR